MICKLDPILIKPENPFREDALNREPLISNLSEFIKRTKTPLVMSISSPWGSGKTTFIKLWQAFLENQNVRTIYFNAWENDFSEDPLIAIISEFQRGTNIIKDEDTLLQIKQHGAKIIKAFLPLALKFATNGLFDGKSEISSLLTEGATKFAESEIEHYLTVKEDLKEFKKILKKLHEENQNPSGYPIVFFVDELDRCRPNFAIELLERIKHIFNIPGFVFVLAVDKEQLHESVKAIYGHCSDSDGYLRKFIDIDYLLPQSSTDKFPEYLFHKFNLNLYFEQKTEYPNLKNEGKKLVNISAELFKRYKFSLRVQEQVFSHISIVLNTIPERFYVYPCLLVPLLCIRNTDPELYQRIITRAIDGFGVIERLSQNARLKDFFELRESLSAEFEALICYTLSERHLRDSLMGAYAQKKKTISQENQLYDRISIIEHIFKELSFKSNPSIEYLANKIEFADDFVDFSLETPN